MFAFENCETEFFFVRRNGRPWGGRSGSEVKEMTGTVSVGGQLLNNVYGE